ncbi:hypothetical protein B9Z55_028736 [Caenorhabditis nigoni]|uniref:Uncharacterized protein n=1 Tax=Caenorhabditis nigoni TaxID=1611254 RepID=A0A2G5SAM1_9PELO|nr:hypothetical protein B9Z55_028736 [Caenorhabditis nigoni]
MPWISWRPQASWNASSSLPRNSDTPVQVVDHRCRKKLPKFFDFSDFSQFFQRLIIESGNRKAYATIQLKGQAIRNLSHGDSYKYLGVKTGLESRVSEIDLIKSVITEVDKVNRSPLAPPQKLDCLKTFVLPKMTYMYGNSIPKLTELKAFANMVMRGVKIIHQIPVRGSPLEYIQLPIGKGGLGVAVHE